MSKDNGGPAFPVPVQNYKDQEGMTLRQYAAIKLRVPDSGCDWLDAMIEKASRDDFAAKAMQGILAACLEEPDWTADESDSAVARNAYNIADAMLKERTK